MSEVEEEEERREAVREKGLSTEGKSDGEPPVTQTKMALAVPAAEAAPTKTEVSGHHVLYVLHCMVGKVGGKLNVADEQAQLHLHLYCIYYPQ